MKKLHTSLVRKHPWYAKWHTHPEHSAIHYAVLAIALVFFLHITFFEKISTDAAGAPIDPMIIAEANGLHLLKEDEYAVVVHPGRGKSTKESFLLPDGSPFTRDGKEGDVVNFISYKSGVATYVPTTSNVTVYNVSDFVGYDESGKIDTAIERKLQKQDKVSVIVRLKLPGKYYDKADSASVRASKSQAFQNAKASVASSIGRAGKVTRDLQIINGMALDVSVNALDGLRHNPNVQHVDLDREVTAVLDTSVAEIKADQVWSLIDSSGYPLTGNGMRIAVIDTGVDYTHPDLGGCFGPTCKVIDGYDFVNNDTNPMDDQGHGTHVAATAAGKGLLNGVAPDAKIVAYKVLNSAGSGSSSAIIAGIQRAVDPNNDGNPSDHVDVGTMSLGGAGNPDDAMSTAVDNATAAGVIFTVAAGNEGPAQSTIGSPGVARTAITVAAACKNAQVGSNSYCSGPIASFSSRGPVIWNGVDLKKPDIAAPGVLICAARWATAFSGSPTCFDDHHIRISGTSMATPHMAGVAALIKQANPSWTPQQVKDQIKNTARALSGMTYNDEGAGEVDVKAAIPFVSRIKSTPAVWTVSSDPTKKISTTNQSFTVTSTDSTITTPTISFTAPIAGITFTPSKSTLSLSNLGTDTFSGTISIDNDTVPAGIYPLSIQFIQNGTTKGAIGLSLTVNSTLTVSPTSTLDYGIDNPSLTSWSSAPITLTLTNKRTDISQTLALSASGLPAGATYQGASTVTIPAGASTTVSTSLQVDNSSLANGKYSGTLSFSSGSVKNSVPLSFVKFHYITLQGTLGDSITIASPTETYYASAQQTPFNVYVNGTGPYDVITQNIATAQVVVKENITPDSSPVSINLASDASRAISISATDINGGSRTLNAAENNLYNSTFGRDVLNGNFWVGAVPTYYISPMSSNYTFGVMATQYSFDNPTYFFGGTVKGGTSGNVTFTNTPADLKKYTFTPTFNGLASGTSIQSPGAYLCGWMDHSFCIGEDRSTATYVTYPYTHTVYSTAPAGSWTKYQSDVTDTNSGNQNTVMTPFMDLRSGEQTFNYYTSLKIPLSIDLNAMTPGIGPMVWVPRIGNVSSAINLYSPKFKTSRITLIHQDYSLTPYADIPYVLYKDGVQISSGNLPGEPDNYYGDSGTIASFPVALTDSGTYKLQANYQYIIQGKTMNASATNTFIRAYSSSTGLVDGNPPSITGFKFLGNGARAEVYDPSANHQVQVLLDPNLGSVSSVTLEIAADGGAYVGVPISGDGTTYTATLPSLPVTGKIALRLTATDNNNNILAFTFEVPKGIVPGSANDTAAPTVSITSPTSGATLSGIATLAATATDNVGVTKVEFYQGSTLIGSATNMPYSISWDTTKLSGGAYSITAKAYDAANNVGTSQVNVSVDNSALDVTPPTATVTSPLTGTTISGLVSITATATDNVAVSYVEAYADSTKIGTDYSAPYNMSWDSKQLANGNYAITIKAYDAAGNIGISSPVAVTISNNASDTTPPTTSITSPTNGATISGITTLSASASDNVGVDHVDFYVGTALIGADAVAPYSIGWNTANSANGTYTLTTKAYDAAGNVGTSSGVTVTVSNTVTPPPDTTLPTTSLTAPANGATISGITTLSASASDNIGVTKVSFYRGTTLIDTDTTGSPDYAITWDTTAVPNGSYTITAKAYDAANNVGTSSPITVTVSNGTTQPPSGDTQAPTISISAPVNGTTVAPSSSVTITAAATDNVGVTNVKLYVNNSLLCSLSGAPYSCSWKAPKASNKTYTINAYAYDAAGNEGYSAPVKITVKK